MFLFQVTLLSSLLKRPFLDLTLGYTRDARVKFAN